MQKPTSTSCSRRSLKLGSFQRARFGAALCVSRTNVTAYYGKEFQPYHTAPAGSRRSVLMVEFGLSPKRRGTVSANPRSITHFMVSTFGGRVG